MSSVPLGRREQQHWAEELFQQVGGRSSLLGWDVAAGCGTAGCSSQSWRRVAKGDGARGVGWELVERSIQVPFGGFANR